MTAATRPVDIGTLVTRTPGVYGGRPCLEGTRFPILKVAVLYNAGFTPEEVARDYRLEISRVFAGFAYYLANREAVDAEVAAETALHTRLAKEQRRSRTASGPIH